MTPFGVPTELVPASYHQYTCALYGDNMGKALMTILAAMSLLSVFEVYPGSLESILGWVGLTLVLTLLATAIPARRLGENRRGSHSDGTGDKTGQTRR